ncbi:TonB-dependent receptor [Altericroceibacterium endophyticum]|uniref:TonB-dependent receptor n=1 Tax=Altericroceibacterium endophyticum TaxID=1808508 RepID=A0A6I4TAG2_9SPHN|nr:TonB-dependent receptor [Altericroceibacterium endophyticum]MXO67161.1 TonB-dependent receptor [Altericroceibacterium endophyticum]
MFRILAMSSTALVSCVLAVPALAQDSAAPPVVNMGGLDEIVVTAQRRTENLQNVAVAASAFNADDLRAKNIADISDLEAAAPALSITDAGITQAVNIRGIGLASNSPNVTAGVATYVDGLFQPPIVQANSFFDLASIEVLRGPQGTLVGSNSTGGAIFINSQNPEFDRVGGYVRAEAGNLDRYGAEGAINLPLAPDLAFRAAGIFTRRDSFYKDVGPFDNDAGRLNEKAGRVGLRWNPGSFQALLKAQLNDRRTGGYAYRPIAGTQFGPYREGDIYTLSYDTPTSLHERAFITSLELRQEFDSGTVLRSLSGYQYKRISGFLDFDGSQAPVSVGGEIVQDYFAGERQYSQEINLISPEGQRFDWIIGGYFQRNDITVRIFENQAGFPTDITPDNQRTTTGIFAQTGYRIVPDVKLELGVRYSHYKATGEGFVRIGRGIPGFPADGQIVSDLGGSHKDGRVTGKAAINWDVDDDNLLYAFVARGYKPGGFNSQISEFSPEIVWNYEIGWKSSLLDRRIRLQVDAFYNDYSDFQFEVLQPATGTTGVENISEGTIKGVEAQLQAKFGGFSFDASGAYVDSKLDGLTFVNQRLIPGGTLGPQCPAGTPSNPPVCYDYSSAIVTTDGGPNLYSPKFTVNLSASYEAWLNDELTLTPRVNFAHTSKRFTYLAYSPVSDQLPAFDLVSASLTLAKGDSFVELYGTNLTKEKYAVGQYNMNEFYGAPREYGVRIGTSF